MDEIFDRNIGVWDEDFQKRLKGITVGVAGVGGSGCALLDILARNGFGRFKIADPDYFERHNIQRQLYANDLTLGQSKAQVAAEHLKKINPDIHLELFQDGVTTDNLENFLDGCDFVHEAIDYSVCGLKAKIHARSREKGIITTTSAIVGTGVSTFVFHPDLMSFGEYFQYDEHPDWKQSYEQIVRHDPDYLDKKRFLERLAQGVVPTTADGAFLTGVSVAGIYKRILCGKPVRYAPAVHRIDLLDDFLYFRYCIDR